MTPCLACPVFGKGGPKRLETTNYAFPTAYTHVMLAQPSPSYATIRHSSSEMHFFSAYRREGRPLLSIFVLFVKLFMQVSVMSQGCRGSSHCLVEQQWFAHVLDLRDSASQVESFREDDLEDLYSSQFQGLIYVGLVSLTFCTLIL